MAQMHLLSYEEVENGIKLNFMDLEGKQFSGVYTNGNLNKEDFKRLIGHKISFTELNNSSKIHIHKAWDGETPIYCDDPYHALDREK